jgi:hypothetical protein
MPRSKVAAQSAPSEVSLGDYHLEQMGKLELFSQVDLVPYMPASTQELRILGYFLVHFNS